MAVLSKTKQAEYDAYRLQQAETRLEQVRRWGLPARTAEAEESLARAQARAEASASLVTPAMRHRQGIRTRSGRYESYGGCDLCGKSIGIDYYSHPRCNEWGLGVQLHRRCADRLEAMPDADALAALQAADAKERGLTKGGVE